MILRTNVSKEAIYLLIYQNYIDPHKLSTFLGIPNFPETEEKGDVTVSCAVEEKGDVTVSCAVHRWKMVYLYSLLHNLISWWKSFYCWQSVLDP